jgi:hypothetical protein
MIRSRNSRIKNDGIDQDRRDYFCHREELAHRDGLDFEKTLADLADLVACSLGIKRRFPDNAFAFNYLSMKSLEIRMPRGKSPPREKSETPQDLILRLTFKS